MRTQHRLPLLLATLLSAVMACAPATEDEVGADEAAATAGQDGWGPSLALRDDTSTFSGNKPQGGWFVTPIHVSLLPNGKVLVTGWERAQEDRCAFPEGSRAHGTTFILDPQSFANQAGALDIQPIDEQTEQTQGWTKDVLYCAGHAQTAKGVLYTGGARYQELGVRGHEAEVGISSARIFEYATEKMRRLNATMQGGPASEPIKSRPQYGPVNKKGWRWYPTNTRLPDGKILVSGGFSSLESANNSLEIFDPANETFSLLVQHDDSSAPLRENMAPGLKDYTHTVLLPEPVTVNGRARHVAMMGWNGKMMLVSTDANVPASERFVLRPNAQRPGGAVGWDSSASLLPSGEILVVGGSNDPNVAKRADIYNPKTDTWSQIDTGIGRRVPATVVLPDGNVLVMGGWNEDGNLPGDRRAPQVIDTKTRTVKTFPVWTNDNFERGYHSFAVMLKDGSVLVGGGIYPKINGQEVTSIGCERTDVRIYRPGYLTKGPRPVVTAAEPIDLEIANGQEKTLPVSGAPLATSGGAVLMALGSSTHSFDQNQRYVALDYRATSGGVAFKAPADPMKAPPGDYLLFLISDKGTPSIGKHVRLKASTAPVPATSNVTFKVDNATTSWGTSVFIIGDAPELGGWDASRAIALQATAYPRWTATIALPRNKQLQFKFIKKDGNNNVTWESGDNRSFTVPNADTGEFTGAWR